MYTSALKRSAFLQMSSTHVRFSVFFSDMFQEFKQNATPRYILRPNIFEGILGCTLKINRLFAYAVSKHFLFLQVIVFYLTRTKLFN